MLSAPAALGDIDLRADNPDFFSWTAELRIERDGAMHGLADWFECKLAKGVWMTNWPLADQAIQRPQAFLPIAEAIPVQARDSVKARVMARPADHLIAWVVDFPATLLAIEEKPRLASHFDQVATLASQSIHYRLDYPRRFEDLARVREAIVEHARSRDSV